MTTNAEQFERAKRVIPGGVNSPVRAFRAVGGTPRFIARADGAYLFDAEGKRYIDYIGSWGPMILGHRHPAVQAAVHAAVDGGLSFGAPTERETELVEAIIDLVPSIDQLRLVSSGTEAAMSALRPAPHPAPPDGRGRGSSGPTSRCSRCSACLPRRTCRGRRRAR